MSAQETLYYCGFPQFTQTQAEAYIDERRRVAREYLIQERIAVAADLWGAAIVYHELAQTELGKAHFIGELVPQLS